MDLVFCLVKGTLNNFKAILVVMQASTVAVSCEVRGARRFGFAFRASYRRV